MNSHEVGLQEHQPFPPGTPARKWNNRLPSPKLLSQTLTAMFPGLINPFRSENTPDERSAVTFVRRVGNTASV